MSDKATKRLERRIEELEGKNVALETKLRATEQRRLIAEAADAHGFKDSVLPLLMKGDDAEIVDIKDVGDGQRVAMVRVGDGVPVRLDEYAEAHWEEFSDALPIDGPLTPVGLSPGRRWNHQPARVSPEKPQARTEEDVRREKLASGDYGGF